MIPRLEIALNQTCQRNDTEIHTEEELRKQNVTLNVIAFICLIWYMMMLVPVVYNTKNYIIAQRRYKTFLVLSFYVLTYLVFTARVIVYSSVIHNVVEDEENEFYAYSISSMFSTYAKIALGYS